MKDTLERRSGALCTLFAWQQTPQDRDSWATITVDGEAAAVWGDDEQRLQAFEGSVHLFCRKLDATPMLLQAGLAELDCSWRLDYMNYEEPTRLLHYHWIWQDWGLT